MLARPLAVGSQSAVRLGMDMARRSHAGRDEKYLRLSSHVRACRGISHPIESMRLQGSSLLSDLSAKLGNEQGIGVSVSDLR